MSQSNLEVVPILVYLGNLKTLYMHMGLLRQQDIDPDSVEYLEDPGLLFP